MTGVARTRDFTLQAYGELVSALREAGYRFMTFGAFCRTPFDGKVVILRHDVDARPDRSVAMAALERRMGVGASYYFRIVPQSFRPEAVREISSLGHEVGYHYEDLTLARGDSARAVQLFQMHLERFAPLCPVTTICMHGSPLSQWDNRAIWNDCDYRSFGIIGEPYFDLDFNEWLYLTDTGMKWNGSDVSVRDKVDSPFAFDFRSTFDVADAFRNRDMPAKVMINTHPQRWNDNRLRWIAEYCAQRAKNVVKRHVVARRKRQVHE